MKVALIGTTNTGGAGRAACRLNQGLNDIGIDSKFFVKYKGRTKEDNINILRNIDVDNNLNDFFSSIFKDLYEGNTMMSCMYPSIGFSYLEIFRSFDVINFHWIANYISLESMQRLAYMGKKLVWTLHDQNPMTGGCHYDHGCIGYFSNCDNCPQMKNNPYNITHAALLTKIKYMPPNMVIVSPSKWLADCAKKSKVFCNHRVEVIKNAVEMDIFKVVSKREAKSKLGIDNNLKVILFGAENHAEKRKGFKQLLNSMAILNKKVRGENILVLTFGDKNEDIEKLGFKYKSLGYIKDDSKLAIAYSAADVVAFSSLEDNLPNIILEALSCDTPLVAYDLGGMPDVIINGKTGYCVERNNDEEFAERIYQVLFTEQQFCCRKYAEQNFQLKHQANSYRLLYEDIENTGNNEKLMGSVPKIYPEMANVLMQYICDYTLLKNGFMEKNIKNILRDIKRRIQSS